MSLVDVTRKVMFNPQIRELLLAAFNGKPLVDAAGISLYPANPFTQLVQFQINQCGGAASLRARGFQPGEPFTGDIEHAKILFVSSNPGYNQKEDSPFYHAEDDSIVMPHYDFLTGVNVPNPQKIYRYGNIRKIMDNFFIPRINNPFIGGNGNRIPTIDESVTPPVYGTDPVPYWTNIQNFANALKPGVPFALTEVVQYRSKSEYGVPEALSACWDYAKEIIACSCADVIVIVAKNSALAMLAAAGMLGNLLISEQSLPFGASQTSTINLYQQNIGGKDRLIFNARYTEGKATLPANYFAPNSAILTQVQAVL